MYLHWNYDGQTQMREWPAIHENANLIIYTPQFGNNEDRIEQVSGIILYHRIN